MTTWTQERRRNVRVALEEVDELIEQARDRINAGQWDEAANAVSGAIDGKYKAIGHFPPVRVNDQESIPFFQYFELEWWKDMHLEMARAVTDPKVRPPPTYLGSGQLADRLRESIARWEQLRDRNWDLPPECTGHFDRIIDGLGQVVAELGKASPEHEAVSILTGGVWFAQRDLKECLFRDWPMEAARTLGDLYEMDWILLEVYSALRHRTGLWREPRFDHRAILHQLRVAEHRKHNILDDLSVADAESEAPKPR